MPTGSKEKTAAGKLKTEGAGKDPEARKQNDTTYARCESRRNHGN
jgi:hypothetical protein